MNIRDMVGKTILSAKIQKRSNYDDTGYLKLDFSDGTGCVVVAAFGTYTGDSFDEYPTMISVIDKFNGENEEHLVDIA